MAAPVRPFARLALRHGVVLCAAVLLMGAGGKAQKKGAKPTQPPCVTADCPDGLPPLDMVLPPDDPEVPETAAAPAPVAAPPPVAGLLHLGAGVGLDLAGRGFDLTAGGFLSVRRRFFEAGPLGFDGGLRASYAPRIRQEFVEAGGAQLPAAVFYAHTGDVSALVSTSLTPFAKPELELAFEAGLGLAWRAGHQKLLDRQFDASGVGLATHVAVTAGWRLPSGLLAGLRFEAAAQPQPVRADAPVMPSDLGAVRVMVTIDHR